MGRYFPSIREFAGMSLTFGMTLFAWIFFRAESIGHAFSIISEIFSGSLFTVPDLSGLNRSYLTILLIILFVVVEWLGREQEYAIAHVAKNWKRPYRWVLYYALVLAIYIFGNFSQSIEFIYFQF